MNKRVFVCLVVGLLALTVVAQKPSKPYQEWNEKDAEKMLDNSPWGRTQVETDTSEMFFKPDQMTPGGAGSSADRAANGATNQSISINYRVRFLSARPIREAFARKVLLSQKEPNPQLASQLTNFVEGGTANFIVVAVDFDTKDPRFRNIPAEAFAAAVVSTLKTTTYLDRGDGKRVFLADYRPPSGDGLGAKFIFPRQLDEKPFLTADTPQVRFYSEVSKKVKLDVRFKVADMKYNGNLEY